MSPPESQQLTEPQTAACGLRPDRKAECWETRPPFTQIDADEHHTCALRAEGDAVCWGQASNWPRLVGQNVVPSGPFISVDTAGRHACGLRSDRTVTCWGEIARGLYQ